MRIREIQQKDDGALFALVRKCLADARLDVPGTAYFDESIKSMSSFYLGNPLRKYFVLAGDDDRALGGAGFAEFNGGRDVAELQKLYLCDEARGKGHSYRLIEAVEREAKRRGFRVLYLETHSNLPAAVHIYGKLGYTRIEGPLPGSEHGAMDCFFVKELG